MKITVITYDYPDVKRSVYTFVKALVDEWGKLGHQVTVISPFSITRTYSLTRYGELPCPSNIRIIRPIIVSLSYHIKIGNLSLTDRIHSMTIKRTLQRQKEKPDVIYCHFWKEAMFAYDFAHRYNIPMVVASGESVIPSFLSEEPYLSQCRSVSKVVCVSSKNKNESVEKGLTTVDKCFVVPNAIDNDLFNVSDQSQLKEQLGIKNTDFVVAFVGWFNERKGSKRVAAALEKLKTPEIKSIFIGSGTEEPVCKGILFKGSLPHQDIPKYLNCADVFVLPTLSEGCCNAIVEAMACGLPVISSDKEFNWDILDNTNAILVDPTDVDEIAKAIKSLYEDKDKRSEMRKTTLEKAADLTISNRAKRIIDIINS